MMIWCANLPNMREGAVTLLHASKNEAHNNAIVLRGYLHRWLKREGQI